MSIKEQILKLLSDNIKKLNEQELKDIQDYIKYLLSKLDPRD